MGLTVTLSNDWQMNPGDRLATRASIAFDSSYPTGGEALTPAMLGLGTIDFVSIGNKAGYVFEYDYTNQKVLVYGSAGITPAGTISAPTFTGSALATHTHDMKVIGGQGAAGTDAVTAPAATDILGKQEAGDADILGADVLTKGGVMLASAGTPAGTVSAPTFTGTAVAAAALAEVAASTNLSTLTGVAVYAIGRA